MVQINLRPIIEDMELHETIQGMLNEAVSQGLIEITGYAAGEPLYALTHSGRKMVETSDLGKYIEHEIEMLQDD